MRIYQYQAAKITIVGAGMVGATTAFALAASGLAAEIVLLDPDRDKAEGEAMDINHGAAFMPPVRLIAGDYSDCTDSNLIVFTAGANQKPGQTRLELVRQNSQIVRDTLPKVLEYAPQAIVIMVTNPVDVLTYVGYKISGLPSSKIIGSGTSLDTSRFRQIIAQFCGVDTRNVHAYIIGEHGDSEVPVWSLANIAGVSVKEFCLATLRNFTEADKEHLFAEVKSAAYNIINRKKATYYAIALTIRRICESILRDENSILTVSSEVSGLYGMEDLCLSLPCIMNENGRSQILNLPLNAAELQALQQSALTVKEIIQNLQLGT